MSRNFQYTFDITHNRSSAGDTIQSVGLSFICDSLTVPRKPCTQNQDLCTFEHTRTLRASRVDLDQHRVFSHMGNIFSNSCT